MAEEKQVLADISDNTHPKSFRFFYVGHNAASGLRVWKRNGLIWTEEDPTQKDGKCMFDIFGRDYNGFAQGTVVRERKNVAIKYQVKKEVFIPDIGSTDMRIWVRYHGNSGWRVCIGYMQNINSDCDTFTSIPTEKTATSNLSTTCPQSYGSLVQDGWQATDQRPTTEALGSTLEKAKPKLEVKLPEIKSYVEKSWHFDPETLYTERKATLNQNKPYQLLEATNKDKQKAVAFYQHHPVPGYEIGRVQVIYNKTFNVKFNEHLKTLQRKQGNPAFAAKWSSMSNPDFRQKVYSLFGEMSLPYTDPDYPDVKLMPVWHGTQKNILDSIFQIGYSNLAICDNGYFGKGLYGAHEAEYSYRVYGPGVKGANGALILNWVAIFSPLPVINNGEFKPSKPSTPTNEQGKPERHGDMCILTGKGNYGNYDGHFVPVVPKNPNNPTESIYFPCKPDQKHVYTEVVVFETAACLPRYLVELQPTLVKAVPVPASKSGYTPTFFSTSTTSAVTSTDTISNTYAHSTNQGGFFNAIENNSSQKVSLSTQELQENLIRECKKGNLKGVVDLINLGGNLTQRNQAGETCLQAAVWSLEIKLIEFIDKKLEQQSTVFWKEIISQYHSDSSKLFYQAPKLKNSPVAQDRVKWFLATKDTPAEAIYNEVNRDYCSFEESLERDKRLASLSLLDAAKEGLSNFFKKEKTTKNDDQIAEGGNKNLNISIHLNAESVPTVIAIRKCIEVCKERAQEIQTYIGLKARISSTSFSLNNT